MADHTLEAGPRTCQWGYFDATAEPALRVASGDRVTIDTVSGNPAFLPPAALAKRVRLSVNVRWDSNTTGARGVKVKDNWADSANALRAFGYDGYEG
jgi:hypothetical protein